MFIMWFSGLRGGVAFALASVSFAAMDFPKTCGGFDEARAATDPHCQDPSMTDSLAILQTTLIIAAFTIFVFGGAITDVAIKFGVLADEEFNARLKEKELEAEKSEGDTMHKSMLLPCLTFEIHEEKGLRQDAAVEHNAAVPIDLVHPVTPSATVTPTSSAAMLAPPAAADAKEMTKTMSLDDKIDEMRIAFPGAASADLKKLLDDNAGDLHQAIISGQGKGFK